MAEEFTPSPEPQDGQGDMGSDADQTTQTPPDSDDGQLGAGSDKGTTAQDSRTTTIESFFDPKTIEGKPELEAAYKQMQGAFTKRMQAISSESEKLEAYNAFMTDPIGQMTEIAKRYGYRLDKDGGQQSSKGGEDDWQPQSWEEVTQKIAARARQDLMKELEPYVGQLQGIQKQSIEAQLTQVDPTWQQYEPQMKANLAKHPSLATDPAMLYRMSVPQEVLESRATQKALQKLQDKASSSQVKGPSTTNQKPGTGMPDKPVSFQEAVAIAKKKLAEDGIHPPV